MRPVEWTVNTNAAFPQDAIGPLLALNDTQSLYSQLDHYNIEWHREPGWRLTADDHLFPPSGAMLSPLAFAKFEDLLLIYPSRWLVVLTESGNFTVGRRP